MPTELIPIESVVNRIYLVRGKKVMLDADLAELYCVLTKNLNLAVRRNQRRFPVDFMFQLSEEEADALRLQIATSNDSGRGGRRYLPYVFTEQGVAMLSSVLRSDRAAEVNVMIMRTFVKLRQFLATNEELVRRVAQYDQQIVLLVRQSAADAGAAAFKEEVDGLWRLAASKSVFNARKRTLHSSAGSALP